MKRNPNHIVYIDVPAGRKTRRVKLSMLNFVQECVSDSCAEDTEVTLCSYIKSGILRYGITKQVAELAMNLNWFWKLEIFVHCGDEVESVELSPDLPFKLDELEPIAQEQRLELLASNPNAVRWGWRARIVGTPT